jgi:hypothetical protein
LHPDLNPVFEVLLQATPDIVSCDESENEECEPVYTVYQYSWRDEKVGVFLRDVEVLAEAKKQNEFNQRTRGKGPRTRIPTTDNVCRPGKPVRGLPKNWYNQTWLKSLTDPEKEQLRMKPEVPLAYTADVRK